MTTDEVLHILCTKSYLINSTVDGEDKIIPLDTLYGVDVTIDAIYIIFDCDIKDGVPEIYKVTEEELKTNTTMGIRVKEVTDKCEYESVYNHVQSLCYIDEERIGYKKYAE